MIIAAIRSALPVILKSAKYTPSTREIEVISRLLNRMKFICTGSTSVRTLAQRAIAECKQPHQNLNPTVELFRAKWGWTEDKLIDVLESLWKELQY